MQRIAELQRDGLWTEKRLPKVAEPSRAKSHWDYLLEEMAWLAADFAQERKWKKASAKKVKRKLLNDNIFYWLSQQLSFNQLLNSFLLALLWFVIFYPTKIRQYFKAMHLLVS